MDFCMAAYAVSPELNCMPCMQYMIMIDTQQVLLACHRKSEASVVVMQP